MKKLIILIFFLFITMLLNATDRYIDADLYDNNEKAEDTYTYDSWSSQIPQFVEEMTLIAAKVKLNSSKNTSFGWRVVEVKDNLITLYLHRLFDDLPLNAIIYKNDQGALKIDFYLEDKSNKILIENGVGYIEALGEGDVDYNMLQINENCTTLSNKNCFSVNTIQDKNGKVKYVAKGIIRGSQYNFIGKEIYPVSNPEVLYAAAYILNPQINWVDFAAAAGVPEKILLDPAV